MIEVGVLSDAGQSAARLQGLRAWVESPLEGDEVALEATGNG
ncbi:hypothetical protein ACFWP7_08980 [Streptomyces sp. NPDC058470]